MRQFPARWLLAVVFTLLSSVSHAQRPDTSHAARPARASSGRLLGVYDEATGSPIADATVIDVLSGDQANTTKTGTVALWFLRAATLIEVRKIGYAPWSAIVDPADTVPLTVTLQRAQTLETVVTTAKFDIRLDGGQRDGFDHRCLAVHVTCVREADIVVGDIRTIGDYIKNADGIESGLRMHGALGKTCIPTYYVDGLLWDTAILGKPIGLPGDTGAIGSPPPFTPSNVKQVEVYNTTTARPTRFSGNPNCGVIVLWTR